MLYRILFRIARALVVLIGQRRIVDGPVNTKYLFEIGLGIYSLTYDTMFDEITINKHGYFVRHFSRDGFDDIPF